MSASLIAGYPRWNAVVEVVGDQKVVELCRHRGLSDGIFRTGSNSSMLESTGKRR